MKTVLFLINGFGVESKDSYSIYDKNLMPRFEELMSRGIFDTIQSKVNNIGEAYRNMSMNINEIYNYSLVDRIITSKAIDSCDVIKNIESEMVERKNKLHIFCLLDKSMKLVEQLKYTIKLLNPDKNKKIFVHVIFTSENVSDYPEITETLSKLNAELNEYASIGMCMGLTNILNNTKQTDLNFLVKCLISEVAEMWQSFKQKLDVSYGIKQSPCLIKPFVVNKGFSLQDNDSVLIWNYDKIDLSNFINTIKAINYGDKPNTITYKSLFQVHNQIPYILNGEVANDCFANVCKNNNFKATLLLEKKDISVVNFYLNGMQNVSSDFISFIESENYMYKPTELFNIINTSSSELIILNYNIENVKSIEELKRTLTNIDIMLGNVYDNSKTNPYTIVVSSLYGMNKVLENEKGEICNVIYTGKIPLIFLDGYITKKDYMIQGGGNINDLFKICYKNVKKEAPFISIVQKKNFLYRLFFK